MRAFVLSAAAVAGLWAPLRAADDVNPEEVIRKFAAKEMEFQQARNNYMYRQSVKLEEVQGGGKWEEVDDIIFTPEGKRIEKVVYAPVISLHHISLSPQDVQDLRNVQPFVLTTPEIPEYDIQYLGKDKVDEVSCYSFSVKPKKMAQGKRYFEGQIWVDDRDLQIVKTYGKGVGLLKKSEDQAFPKFETYREQIDGKYWFPTYTRANDTLHFKNGDSVPIRMVVRYQDYKKFEGRSTIKFGEVVDDGKNPPAGGGTSPTTPPKKK
ncbi:MAG TPA: hypothetical protein VMH28_01365 [Candidatus Acidoferrales bacterium]|nr:hypothetical protein [Candidatus Acidoferrales bacterium]